MKKYLVVLLITGMIAAGYWAFYDDVSDPGLNLPDNFATKKIAGFEYRRIDRERTLWGVKADTGVEYDSGILEFRNVDALIYRGAGESPVAVTSRQARYDPVKKRLVLSGEVRIRYDGIVVSSEKFFFEEPSGEIFSPERVRIVNGENELESFGLRFNLDRKRLVLKDVTGEIVPSGWGGLEK